MKKNKTMKELLRSYILSPEDRDYAFRNVDKDKLRKVIEDFPKYLKGIRYHKKNICSELRLYWAEDKQEEEMIADIIEWIKEEEL